jgi:hypothetical protein
MDVEETVSTENPSPAVTTAPSPPGDENTGPSCFATGCWILVVVLIGFGIYFSVGLFRFLEGLGKFFGGVKDFSDAVESVFKGG